MVPTPETVSPPPGAAPMCPLRVATEFDVDIHWLSKSGQFIIKQLPKATPAFKLQRTNWSCRRERRLYDLNDVALYKMYRPRVLDCRHTTHIVDEQRGHTVFELRRKGWCPGWGGNTILAWHGHSEGKQPYLSVHTGWFRRQFFVEEHATGKLVAKARREKLGRKFILRVEAGYHGALMVMFAIAVDVIYQDVNAAIAAGAGTGAAAS